MDLKNKIPSTQPNAFFYVAKEMLFLYKEIGKSIRKKPTYRQSAPSNLEGIAALGPDTIRNIEEKLRLDFVPEKKESGSVCMANSPEIRDEYKYSFEGKDLLDFIYAVLHSPDYTEKYKDFSKTDSFKFPIPTTKTAFGNW